MFFLRRPNVFNVWQDILTAVYQSLIEFVLTFKIASCYYFLTVKTELTRIIKHATKITSTSQTQVSDLYSHAVKRKADSISKDLSHPLHHSFQLLPSGSQFRVPLAKKRTYKNLHIAAAIHFKHGQKDGHYILMQLCTPALIYLRNCLCFDVILCESFMCVLLYCLWVHNLRQFYIIMS